MFITEEEFMIIAPGIYAPAKIASILTDDLEASCAFKQDTGFSAVLVFGSPALYPERPATTLAQLMSDVAEGRGRHHGGSAGADLLKDVLGHERTKILVITNDGGQFEGSHRRAFETGFPGIIWHFPAIRDYGSSVSMRAELANDLQREGLLDVMQLEAA